MTLETYDPNLVLSGRSATQTVRLTFQQWEYTAVLEVSIGGTCTGLTVIESAIDAVFCGLSSDGRDIPYLIMTDTHGSELIAADDDDCEEEWLSTMLVKAEIVKVEADAPDVAD